MEIVSAVVGSLVSKIAELSAEPVIKQFSCMFCFNNFVKEFSEQWRSLALARRRVQHAVDVAIRNAEEIDTDVNKWLEDAKKALAVYGLQDAVDVATKNAEEIEIDVNKWLEDAKNEMEGENRLENEKGKNGKCFTWCPKWICQFKLSKALEKKTETLRKLVEEREKFQKVAHKVPPPDIEFLPSKEFTPSESSKEAFKQIMKALKDDNVNMIGLYGMGGVGKTTLVKEVGRRAKETRLFDEVLLATVSQNPNVMYMQDRMADNLDLHFDKNTIEGRANQLWQRLKTEKKMLVILDDVWKVVNLKEIGIPVGDDHRGCKVLLTTRLRGICLHMQCQQQVLLSILSENEAWALFKINAGLRDEDSNLNTVAEEVARECQGLPIALVTVGRALRDKSTVEWEVAFKQLKNSQFQHMELIGEQKNIYSCLKFSYDYLKHEKTKLCFLLCCLFPEDYDIPIEDLTRYTVGYGLHQDVESIEDARKEVYVAIKTLKDCCMLLGTETEEDVKMHDLVRDVAIQIASSKEHGFMVKAGIGLKEWPRSNKSFEGCTTISLMGNELAELPEGLVCPQLKVLLLELGEDLNVPEKFFEGMEEIEVLSLQGGCLSLQSLNFSTNLKSLLLIRCKCNDLIWLRKLQRLQILGFIGCSSLEELPDEIGELKELRLLDVTGCSSLGRIPVNLIGRLKKLEELLISYNSFTEGTNASLTELNLLSHLAVLSLKIPRVECIPRDIVFSRLLKYDIVLGNRYSETAYPTSTRLYLCDINAASINAKIFEQLFPTVSQIGFVKVEGLQNIALSCDQMTSHDHGSQKDFFQSLEDVEVKRCRDIRTLFPAKWRQALNNLTSVVIDDCKSLEVVFELGEAGEGINEELRLLSSLTRLELLCLPELDCIWKGPTRHVSLRSLIHLELWCLDNLTFIFTPHLAQNLVHLETLRIDFCSGLKHLIREKDDEREIIPDSLGFPKLKTLCIRGCHKLEYVFPVSVSPSLLNLEKMEIDFGANLKEIFYSGEGDALTRDGIINFPQQREFSLSRQPNFTVQLPSLQVLAIKGHEELGDLLAQLQGRTNLREIRITDCKGAQDRRTGHELSNLRLEKLELTSMPDMRCIWKGLVLSHLTSLKVSRCEKLTHVFTGSMAASIVQLKKIVIVRCSELEQIIAKDLILSGSDLQSLCFPNLCEVEIDGCNKLRSLFPVAMAAGLPKLEKLAVCNSSQLLGVFWQDDDASPVNVEKQMVLPNLSFLKLDNLPSIVCFSLGCDDFLFPRLGNPMVDECPKLTTKFANTTEGRTNLREIRITDCKGAQDRRTGHELSNLSLEKLELTSMPDMRCIWKGLVLSHLTSLKVSRCEKLTHVFTGSMVASLVQLKLLVISGCGELEQIIAKDKDDEREIIQDSLGFPKLKTLSISDCEKLEYVFRVSVSPSLLNLEKMKILCCANLKQIFYSGEGDALTRDGIINFPRLRKLWLSSGCNFFGPKHFTAQLPSLKVLAIDGHEELGDLLAQLQGHTNLRKIHITNCKGAQDRRTGHELSLLSLEKLHLKSLPDMRCIWKGLVLSHLTTLKVYDCHKLTHVFTGSMVASLAQLRKIVISGCEELEQIIAKDNDDEKDQILSGSDLQSLCFPNLCKVEIKGCNKLRCIWKGLVLSHLTTLEVRDCEKLTHVFTGSMVASLVQLQSLYISDCSELEQIIAKDNDDEKDQILSGSDLQSLCFPSLCKVEIKGCNKLRCIWKGLVLSHLTTLKVYDCHKLTHVFTDSMVASLAQLRKIVISGCEELEQIIAKDNDDEKDQILSGSDLQSLCFPNLCKVEIKGCNKLRCIWKGLVLSHLTTLEVRDCEKLTHVFTGSMVASLVQLQSLYISDCSELEQIIAKDNDDEKDQILSGSDLQSLCFPSLCKVEIKGCNKLRCIWKGLVLSHLTTLKVYDCHKLTHVFTDSMVASLAQLRKIVISGCEELEQIIAKDNDDEKDQILSGSDLQSLCFPNLCKVEIKGCNKLRCIWKGLVLSHLTTLEVRDCEKLTHVFTGSMVASLVQLQSLYISDCSELEQIIAKDKDDEREIIQESLGFPKLKTLLISDCEKLEYVFPVSVSPSLLNLEKMKILCCANLKQIYYGGEGDAHTSDDEREIIQDSLGFPKLKTLSISDCEKLEYVFRVSVSPSLLNLEKMKILCCANLKQIFYSGEGDALTRDGIINFPRLRKLCLSSGCNFFGPKHFTAQFPSLQELSINGHEELGDLLAQLQGLTNLRDIYITSCKGAQHLMQAGSFVPNRRTGHEWWQALKNLATMKIEKCESLEEVFELGEAGEGINEEKELLSSLTRLKLENLPELKCIWKGPTRHVSLQSLVHLELQGLDKLTFIFTLHLAQSLVHLETLRIHGCGELKHLIKEKDDEREIIQDSLGFPKLKTLLIGGCDKLEYVFPVSVSPSLPNLEEMEIEFGANLKQIFYRGEGDALTRDGIINFPQQRELSLSRPTNFTVQLPSLQVLVIKGHEELGDFLAQLQGHTNLRKIHITNCKGAQDRRTGHELSLLSLEKLHLKSLPDMRCIWKGLVLSHLTTLKVYDCHKLTHVFTDSMVASLAQLRKIVISGCEELEQIIAKDNDDEKDQILSGSDLQSLCFPNLCKVEIKGCNKLRCIWKGLVLSHLTTLEVRDCEKLTHVFTGSMVASLVHLQSLYISDCSELEQIIAKDNDDEKGQILSGSDLQSLCFPNLCEVEIDGCNKLRSLFPVAMAAGLPKLETLAVCNSSQLLGVFWQDDDEASPVNVEKQMVLPNLSFLKLDNLPSIVCFSLGCDDFLFPRMEDLMVDECPKLTTNVSMSAQSEASQSS